MMSPLESSDLARSILATAFGTMLTSMGINMRFFEKSDPNNKKIALVCGSIGIGLLGVSMAYSYESISNYPIESLGYAWVPLLAFAYPFAVEGIKNPDDNAKKVEKTIVCALVVAAVYSYVVAFALKP